jgi:hypothetical protein
MNRTVKIVLFGLLGGLVCIVALRSLHLSLVWLAGISVLAFLTVALLAAFATKE